MKNNKLDITKLNPSDAELLLRKVIKGADLFQPGNETKIVPSAEIFEELLSKEPFPAGTADPANDELDIAQQALMVLAADKAFEDHVENPEKYADTEVPTSFSIDPVSIISLTTLAMVVLSTYMHIKKDKHGHWTFELKINPMSDKLKKELFNLIKKLTTGIS